MAKVNLNTGSKASRGPRGDSSPRVDMFAYTLFPFQREFLKRTLGKGIHTSVCSLPRGNGKTSLAAMLGAQALTPGNKLFTEGTESLLFAASLAQARRTVFQQLLDMLPLEEYRIADSQNLCNIRHKKTNTRLSILAANHKTAQGLGVSNPLVLVDEPGAMEIRGGEALHDAIETAKGKPGQNMKLVYTGTLAPNPTPWWLDLATGRPEAGIHRYTLQGDIKRYSDLRAVYKCNPLMRRFEASRNALKDELRKAERDERLKARFLSFRLNVPSQTESTMLLAVQDFERMVNRPVPEREGRPVVGIDAGGNRAWSSATAIWPNQRVECVAIAPGVPSIREQEKRDRVSNGVYQRLVDMGLLRIATGRRIPLMEDLIGLTRPWRPAVYVSDFYRLGEVRDCVDNTEIVTRRQWWQDASEDIRGTRQLALDGNLAIEPNSRHLLAFSLSKSKVENDSSGNSRLIKSAANNVSRDDISQSFVLAAGLLSRVKKPRKIRHATV